MFMFRAILPEMTWNTPVEAAQRETGVRKVNKY